MNVTVTVNMTVTVNVSLPVPVTVPVTLTVTMAVIVTVHPLVTVPLHGNVNVTLSVTVIVCKYMVWCVLFAGWGLCFVRGARVTPPVAAACVNDYFSFNLLFLRVCVVFC